MTGPARCPANDAVDPAGIPASHGFDVPGTIVGGIRARGQSECKRRGDEIRTITASSLPKRFEWRMSNRRPRDGDSFNATGL